MKNKVLFIITFVCFFSSILVYYSANIDPEKYYIIGFLTFLIPIFIIANVIILFIWLFYHPLISLVPLFALLLGYRFIASSYVLNLPNFDKTIPNLKVMSYNVRVFNSYEQLRSDKNYGSSKKIIKFIKESEADIVCIQEFYNKEHSNIFNTIKKIKKKYPYYYFTNDLKNAYGGQFGLAIFSKFPINSHGIILFGKKTKNKACYIDIKINQTPIRIYNIHLQSMKIDEDKFIQKDWDNESKNDILLEISKVKNGLVSRASQLKLILENMETHNKKVIVCGDLNDIPFSYTYQQLKNKLNNAHEEAGFGWGSTYNGKIPFLRIDNQFFDPSFRALESKTFYEINYSDHFPVYAEYFVPENKD